MIFFITLELFNFCAVLVELFSEPKNPSHDELHVLSYTLYTLVYV